MRFPLPPREVIEQLFTACGSGDISALSQHLPLPYQTLFSLRNACGNSLLRVAVTNRHVHIVEALLACFTGRKLSHFLLSHAVESGVAEIVKLVLDRTKSINVNPSILSEQVRRAVELGHANIVTYLMTSSYDVGVSLSQVMNHACFHGQLDVVRASVSLGADIDPPHTPSQRYEPLFSYQSPLEAALSGSRHEVVIFLVESGAAFDMNNFELCKCAARGGRLALVKKFMSFREYYEDHLVRTVLIEVASMAGSVDVVSYLLSTYAQVADDQYLPSLFLALSRGHDEIASLVFDRCPAHVFEGYDMVTLFETSLAMKCQKASYKLLNYVDVNCRSEHGERLYHVLCEVTDPFLVAALLRKGSTRNMLRNCALAFEHKSVEAIIKEAEAYADVLGGGEHGYDSIPLEEVMKHRCTIQDARSKAAIVSLFCTLLSDHETTQRDYTEICLFACIETCHDTSAPLILEMLYARDPLLLQRLLLPANDSLLAMAIRHRNLNAISCFLHHGADPNLLTSKEKADFINIFTHILLPNAPRALAGLPISPDAADLDVSLAQILRQFTERAAVIQDDASASVSASGSGARTRVRRREVPEGSARGPKLFRK